MTQTLKNVWLDENGQGMVEYGLIIALVAVAAIAALTLMGGKLNTLFSGVNDKLTVTP